MIRTLVDTGFLVGAFASHDNLKASAKAYLTGRGPGLITTAPVIVETCFFLKPAEKRNLLEWVQRGGVELVEWPVSAYAQTNAIVAKYADRDIDIADAALIWLAGFTNTREILTSDIKDFSVYRLAGGKRFELIDWFV